MEFSNIGAECNFDTCKLNDFLPFTCQHCNLIFCKNHFNTISHNCQSMIDNIATNSGKTFKNYICTNDDCKNSSTVEMNCSKCKKHYCLGHRYHGCFEESPDDIAKKLKKWEKPNEEFNAVKTIVDAKINENLRKSKNPEMAYKVQLMRLKGRAIGSKTIPTDNRRYFFIHLPIALNKKEPQAIFVSVDWTIGKSIDSISDLLKIKNSNNLACSEKLRLFHHITGEIVDTKMDTILTELFDKKQLINGQNLIFEYSNNEIIDASLYK